MCISGNMWATSYAAAEVVLTDMAKTKGFGGLTDDMEGVQARYEEGDRVIAGTEASSIITGIWCAPRFQLSPKVQRVAYLELVIMLPYIPCCLL